MVFNCKPSVDLKHKCFILTEDEAKERDTKYYKNPQKDVITEGYIFFDIEIEIDKIFYHQILQSQK